MNLFFKISCILFLVFVSCKEKRKDKEASDISIGTESEIEKIKLTELSSSPLDLKQYQGKTIFINFWATWCKPCLQEMPSIQQAMEKLKDEKVVFLFASNEAVDQIEKFKTNHNYKFNYVRIENLEDLNIMALPTTYIFSPEGKLEFSEMGYRNWDDQKNIDLIRNIAK